MNETQPLTRGWWGKVVAHQIPAHLSPFAVLITLWMPRRSAQPRLQKGKGGRTPGFFLPLALLSA